MYRHHMKYVVIFKMNEIEIPNILYVINAQVVGVFALIAGHRIPPMVTLQFSMILVYQFFSLL